MVPVAQTPPQNIEPWSAALARLTTDRAHWQQIAAQSRTAALAYLATLSVEPFERILFDILRHPKTVVPAPTDARKRLATMLLKQRAWFPTLNPASRARLRLFCFPHAGAGTLFFRGWSIEDVEICPVLLPGREGRASEPAVDNMPDLIAALLPIIRPLTSQPYALFGHSMGAGIAFELARKLERPPHALIVSSARAPQYRINLEPRPDPSDEELLSQISILGANPAALETALPVLRADTRLYRNYRFQPGPPLNIPIAAYCGSGDPSLKPQDMAGWKELTTARFTHREFPGGHFYLQLERDSVLRAIAADVS